MKLFVYSVLSLLAGTCIGNYFAYNRRLLNDSTTLDTDTIRLLYTDTILHYDTITIHLPTPSSTRPSAPVTLPASDLLQHTSPDSITLQAETRIYSDSTYRAVISGIFPTLDTLTIYRPTLSMTQSVTERIVTSTPYASTRTTSSASRWSLGITAGLTATTSGLTPGITLGLTYRLWP